MNSQLEIIQHAYQKKYYMLQPKLVNEVIVRFGDSKKSHDFLEWIVKERKKDMSIMEKTTDELFEIFEPSNV